MICWLIIKEQTLSIYLSVYLSFIITSIMSCKMVAPYDTIGVGLLDILGKMYKMLTSAFILQAYSSKVMRKFCWLTIQIQIAMLNDFVIYFLFTASAFNHVNVIVYVKDVNDNMPVFVFPELGNQKLKVYVGMVSADVHPFTSILRVSVSHHFIFEVNR